MARERATRRSCRTAQAKPRTRPSRTWRSARRRTDQDRFGKPDRSRLQVQPAAAHRRGARRRGAVRGPRGDRSASRHMHKLVLLRHGESTWNKENRFTGWTDVDLSERGLDEAQEAGRLLREGGYDVRRRLHVGPQARDPDALDRARRAGPDVDSGRRRDWRLNERHYGALQGLNKAETAAKHGEAQVEDLAAQLRHPAAAARRRRSAASVARSALRGLCSRASCR